MTPDKAASPVPSAQIMLGRNQFELLTEALEGLLALLVEDWTADVPIAADPWAGAGPVGRASGTGAVWSAIDQGRAVLSASQRWGRDITELPS